MSLFDLLQTLLSQIYPISGYVIVGILLLILSGVLGLFATLQLNLWNAMWLPVNVVHQQVAPATQQVAEGVVGCLLGVPARILQWVCFLSGLDLILFQGRITLWLAETIGLIQRIP